MRVYKCMQGSSVAVLDEQTYKAISSGYCIPVCSLDANRIRCKFEARIRSDSSISAADLTTSPFTAISGADFKHMTFTKTTYHSESAAEGVSTSTSSHTTAKPVSHTTTAPSHVYPSHGSEKHTSTIEGSEYSESQTEHSVETTRGASSTCESDTKLCGCQAVPSDVLPELDDVRCTCGRSLIDCCVST